MKSVHIYLGLMILHYRNNYTNVLAPGIAFLLTSLIFMCVEKHKNILVIIYSIINQTKYYYVLGMCTDNSKNTSIDLLEMFFFSFLFLFSWSFYYFSLLGMID